MIIDSEFHGAEFLMRVNRAAGRAIVGIGVAAAVETKRVTHVETGNLRRSVHVAPPDEDHSDDESSSESSDMLQSSFNVAASESPEGPIVELGSWLDYACTEWVGRSHPGVQQGLESVRGARATAIVIQAFTEEGLGRFGGGGGRGGGGGGRGGHFAPGGSGIAGELRRIIERSARK